MARSHLLVAATLVAAFPLTAQGFPCWESNLGTNLALGDDAVSPAQALGFSFPFAGGAVTDIEVSSNGFVYLLAGSTGGSGCCNGNVATMLTGEPRIAPVWMDLNPNAGGGVYFNSISGRAVVTWDQVPEYGSSTNTCSVQLQMDASGQFQISIRELTVPSTHTLVVGVSEGVAAVDPGESDYSTGVLASLGNPTVYEEFLASEPKDIAGKTFNFLPDGSGGWIVAENTSCRLASFSTYGGGCPDVGPAHYEFFDFFNAAEAVDLSGMAVQYLSIGGGRYLVQTVGSQWEANFGTNLGLTDDSLSGPQPLGFTADIAGVPGVSDIDVSSNGFVYVGSHVNTSSGCCSGDLTAFLDDDARIAALWQDLNPASAGAVYFNALPGKAVVTYDQVPEFGSAGLPQTFQLQIFVDGSFTIEWMQVSNTSHDCLVGMSVGNGATDPGESDLSAGGITITGAASTGPITLGAAAGSVPALGAAFTLDIGNMPPNSVVGFMVLGFTQMNPGMSLAPLGMEGCEQFLTLDDSFPFPVTPGNPMSSFTFNIPNQTNLIGLDAFVQAAVLAPGVNQFGIAVSNGGVLAVGL